MFISTVTLVVPGYVWSQACMRTIERLGLGCTAGNSGVPQSRLTGNRINATDIACLYSPTTYHEPRIATEARTEAQRIGRGGAVESWDLSWLCDECAFRIWGWVV